MASLHEVALELEGQRVVVVGLARSGIAAARFLARHGARVVATDRKAAEGLSKEALSLESLGVSLRLGAHDAADFAGASLVVVSPGVAWDLPELGSARDRGVTVVAEIELAYRHLSGTVAAVTGTKGKSTTTAALGAMAREAGRDVRVGGNIGRPLIDLVEGSTPDTLFVVEVSSFQLQAIDRFRAHVAVFLNVSADHLDRHRDLDEYVTAKSRVFENQEASDFALVNADDPLVLDLARRGRARVVPFVPPPRESVAPAGGDGAYLDASTARFRFAGRDDVLFERRVVQLPGLHLLGDLLAAGAAARLLGVPPEAIARAVAAFRGTEHVLERVADVGGVAFFNDSKATNIDAARHSLESFSGPLVAILGGRHKGGDFADLRPAVVARCRAVVAIGESRRLVADALGDTVRVIDCPTLDAAVRVAYETARPDGTVLLAPACSSFDMFEDYAARGRAFKDAVARLRSAETAGGRDRG